MKSRFLVALCAISVVLIAGISTKSSIFSKKNRLSMIENLYPKPKAKEEKPCVFMSLMGEQPVDGFAKIKEKKPLSPTLERGENWLLSAQNNDGGWGAGSHNNQQERNPHAVQSDPSTTAMSAMALYRCGYTLKSGKNSEKLKKSLEYLLSEVEKNRNYEFITQVRGTQIQSKLGQNIDAVLTLQFLNQVVTTLDDKNLKTRVNDAIQNCVDKIEKSYDASGKVSNAGWAGVLQSSFANSALEEAGKNANIKVDEKKAQAGRDYQKSNYNAETDNVNSADGAGVMLYAVSSSVRGSAKEAKDAQVLFDKAKASGKLKKEDVFNEKNLITAGASVATAGGYVVATKIYEAAKNKAMDENVMNGFGNNGGEEFMSFLQTGESMIVKHDNDWKKWYDNVSGKMMKIQNQDGSWNGHHCITSPAFCTATSLLILSIENDIKRLQSTKDSN